MRFITRGRNLPAFILPSKFFYLTNKAKTDEFRHSWCEQGNTNTSSTNGHLLVRDRKN